MLLEVLGGGSGELHSGELEPAHDMSDSCPAQSRFEAVKKWPDSEWLKTYPLFSKRLMMGPTRPRCHQLVPVSSKIILSLFKVSTYLNTVRLDGNEAVYRR